MQIDQIIDLAAYPIDNAGFRGECKERFDEDGVLVLPGFTTSTAIKSIHAEGHANSDNIYAKTEQHTVYLNGTDPDFPADHARNRLVTSSKGCLTDDQVPGNSALRILYDAPRFRAFLCEVLGEKELHHYADPLSSINLHFAETGQELGWHFDNSSFSITLMVQPPEKGGEFEYVSNVRDADSGEMGFDAVADILDGKTPVKTLAADAGTLAFFRGRNAMHRVAPNLCARARVLAVLAYNSEPGVALSEAARRTFYGRTG